MVSAPTAALPAATAAPIALAATTIPLFIFSTKPPSFDVPSSAASVASPVAFPMASAVSSVVFSTSLVDSTSASNWRLSDAAFFSASLNSPASRAVSSDVAPEALTDLLNSFSSFSTAACALVYMPPSTEILFFSVSDVACTPCITLPKSFDFSPAFLRLSEYSLVSATILINSSNKFNFSPPTRTA